MPNEILETIDARLEQALPLISSIQEDYKEDHGVYAQGLFTHSSTPEENEEVSPDSLLEKPTDQDQAWGDLAPGLFTYSGPSGHGYVIVLEKKIGDTVYVRSHNVGPQPSRSHDWQPQ
jgi:hypothetical protein